MLTVMQSVHEDETSDRFTVVSNDAQTTDVLNPLVNLTAKSSASRGLIPHANESNEETMLSPTPLSIGHEINIPVDQTCFTDAKRYVAMSTPSTTSTPLFQTLFTKAIQSSPVLSFDPTLYGLNSEDMSWLNDQALLFTQVTACMDPKSVWETITLPLSHTAEAYDIETHVVVAEESPSGARRISQPLPYISTSTFAYRGEHIPEEIRELLADVEDDYQHSLSPDVDTFVVDNNDNDDVLSELALLSQTPNSEDTVDQMKETVMGMWNENERKRLRKANKGLHRTARGNQIVVSTPQRTGINSTGGSSGASSVGTVTPVRRIEGTPSIKSRASFFGPSLGLPRMSSLAHHDDRSDHGDDIEEISHNSVGPPHLLASASFSPPSRPLGVTASDHRRILSPPQVLRRASLSSSSLFPRGSTPLITGAKRPGDKSHSETTRRYSFNVGDKQESLRSSESHTCDDDSLAEGVVVNIVGGDDDTRMQAYLRYREDHASELDDESLRMGQSPVLRSSQLAARAENQRSKQTEPQTQSNTPNAPIANTSEEKPPSEKIDLNDFPAHVQHMTTATLSPSHQPRFRYSPVSQTATLQPDAGDVHANPPTTAGTMPTVHRFSSAPVPRMSPSGMTRQPGSAHTSPTENRAVLPQMSPPKAKRYNPLGVKTVIRPSTPKIGSQNPPSIEDVRKSLAVFSPKLSPK